MRIIAIDPGVTTGWAVGSVSGDPEALEVEAYGYDPWTEFVIRLDDAMQDHDRRFDVIVFETWRLYKAEAMTQVGSDMPSSQCVGCIWFAYERAKRAGHAVKLLDQPAAIKKVIDARMGGADLYLPKSDVEHDRDALRHLWYWFMRRTGGL